MSNLGGFKVCSKISKQKRLDYPTTSLDGDCKSGYVKCGVDSNTDRVENLKYCVKEGETD
jgi:hypothetical protein